MINIPPIKQSNAIKAELIPDISRTWKVGQILNATTSQGGDALSKVLIQVGQYTLEAKTPVALSTGQDVKLLVKDLANEQTGKLPQLSILRPDADKASLTQSLATTKLRLFIAAQQSFSQVQQLAQTLLTSNTNKLTLPETLKTDLSRLQSALHIPHKGVTTQQLKQYILNSGIFLESKLHKQLNDRSASLSKSESVMNDFKHQLLSIKTNLSQTIDKLHIKPADSQSFTPQQIKLLESFIYQASPQLFKGQLDLLINTLTSSLPRPAINLLVNLLNQPQSALTAPEELQSLARLLVSTSQQTQSQQGLQNLIDQLRFRMNLLELGQLIDSSISKLTSLQLQPLSRDGDNMLLLLFNLVFKDSHEQFDLNFRFQQLDEENQTSNENWVVTVTFNFRTLGKVQSHIHLMDDRISTVFHTELESTSGKIQSLLPLLDKGLSSAGLNVVNLAVNNSLLDDKPLVSSNVNLLDENI